MTRSLSEWLLWMSVTWSVSALAATPPAVIKGLEARIAEERASADFSISVTGSTIMDLDYSDSTITRFVSDKGNNLGVKGEGMSDYVTMPYFASCQTWDDRKTMTVTVTSPLKIGPGATRFELEGTLKTKYAARTDKGQIKELKIQDGTEVLLGGIKGKVKDVVRKEKLDFDLFFASVPPDFDIKEVKLIDAKGDEIRGSRNTTRIRIENNENVTLSFYRISPPPDVLTVDYELWMDVREAIIPYKVTSTLAGAAPEAAKQPSAPAVSPAPAPAVATVAAPSAPVPVPPPAVQSPAPSGATAVIPAPPAITAEPAWPSLRCTGVMGTGKRGTAIINGQMVNIGEKIEGAMIINITGPVVTLKFNNKTRTLKSGESIP